jgi:hypothetical protein
VSLDAAEPRRVSWGRGFAVVVALPDDADTTKIYNLSIDVERTVSWEHPRLCRIVAFCTSSEAADAALRLLGSGI